MKNLFNSISQEEKSRILEMHSGKKNVISEQPTEDMIEYTNLGNKLKTKYPEICKYDTINKFKDGSSKVRLNTGGKIYSFDSDVKKYQELHNKIQPSYKIKVDGIIGPEMKKHFCTVS
jgi:hypothetical protein